MRNAFLVRGAAKGRILNGTRVPQPEWATDAQVLAAIGEPPFLEALTKVSRPASEAAGAMGVFIEGMPSDGITVPRAPATLLRDEPITPAPVIAPVIPIAPPPTLTPKVVSLATEMRRTIQGARKPSMDPRILAHLRKLSGNEDPPLPPTAA